MMFDMPDEARMAWARPLGPFLCDAVFGVAASLYTGPENGFSQQEWESSRVLLDPPELPPRLHGFVATVDLIGREAALIAFYERLITTAEKHGKRDAIAKPFPYFRVTPTILEADQPVLSFPWTDDVRETGAILTALAGAGPDGLVWDDIDQGWFVQIACRDGTLFMMEGDPDEDEPDIALRADASAVAAQASAALMRLNALHGRMMQAFGQDFWTVVR